MNILKFMTLSALVGATFLGFSFSWAKTCTFYYSVLPPSIGVGKVSYKALTCAECTTFAAFFHLPKDGGSIIAPVTCS
jgi:hypothetical protein